MKWIAGFLAVLAVMLLGGCALAAEKGETELSATHESEVREGISEPSYYDETLGADYDTGTGWSFEMMNRKPPLPAGNDTVLNTPADPSGVQVLYLWEEGKAPARTSFTPNMTGYYDEWDFRPYVTALPIPEGMEPKGAVVLLAGGAYQFRGDYTDTLPTALHLRALGR